MSRAWSVYRFFLALLVLTVLALNLRLYQSPSSTPEEILPHLKFQRTQLESGSARRMQRLFPEGYLFSYCLYGISWVDLAVSYPELKPQALEEARWALAQLDSAEGRAPFAATQDPPHGVFYLGWSNWLRGGVVKLDPDGPEAPRFKKECQTLAKSFSASSSPYLDAYPGQAWPCDSTVAMANLALHDALFPANFQDIISTWVESVGPGLFPHQVKPVQLKTRGTSQVMIQRFLFEIDPNLAAAQYQEFRSKFVTTRLGLPGVREYPLGTDGAGDVDSGPLVFGFSFSATGVLPGAARLHSDQEVLKPFGQLINTFGFPLAGRYLGGSLPVADALLVWSRTAVSWTGQTPPSSSAEPIVGLGWRFGFHGFWLLVVLGAFAPFMRRRKPS